MTADAKTNNDSSEKKELEKTEAKCNENEIENTRQTGEMLECSLCQVKEDAPKRLQLLHRPPYSIIHHQGHYHHPRCRCTRQNP